MIEQPLTANIRWEKRWSGELKKWNESKRNEMNIKIQQAIFQLESRPSNSQSSSLNCAENFSSSLFEAC